MYAVERLGYQYNCHVVIYRDGFWFPSLFGTRFARRIKVADRPTNLDPGDPRTFLDVLMEQSRLDHERGRESQINEYSLDVWNLGEYGADGCEPIVPGWRYTPGMQAHPEYGAFSA